MNRITAINVSNYFTNRAIDQGFPFTIMQALKLTYIAQGFHLSLKGGDPFFEEDVFAWEHGPVIKDLYFHFKDQLVSDNSYMIKNKQPSDSFSLFRDMQKQILYVVFNKYGILSGWDLSELTHKEGTPWAITYNQSPNSIISKDLIKRHFEKIITPLSFSILLSQE